jgi:hypothetical protein
MMTVEQLIAKMDLRVFVGGSAMAREISGGYTSDLLSDVIGHAKEDMVWITLQSHVNVVAVASLKDLAAIILVNGLEPGVEAVVKATEEGITLLGTREGAFRTSALLYLNLHGDV